MKSLSLSYEKTCQISPDKLYFVAQQIKPELQRIIQARSAGYESIYASINLPADSKMHKEIIELARKKRNLNPVALVVIGIGGSNLGTKAVYEALYGKFYNEHKPDIKVYWADTVDSDYILDIILLLEQDLLAGREVIFNIVSKSGLTTETIANFNILLDFLKRNRPYNYRDYIVITTDEESPLWNLAHVEQFDRLIIPKNVGGRYSALSAVALFPLMLLGIDIKKLAAGAQDMVERSCSENFCENPAVTLASLLYINYCRDFFIHDLFLFSNDLESLGMWHRQLLAESIGKERDIEGDIVNIGITPTVSIGSTDLHSMAQLHLGGPNNTFTTFISVEKTKSEISVPCLEKYEQLIEHISCKSLSSIMNATLLGVQNAYREKKRPFATIRIPEKSSWHIGQFLQMNMMAIIYLGYLLHINPFNQPEVELYKDQTRKILAHE